MFGGPSATPPPAPTPSPGRFLALSLDHCPPAQARRPPAQPRSPLLAGPPPRAAVVLPCFLRSGPPAGLLGAAPGRPGPPPWAPLRGPGGSVTGVDVTDVLRVHAVDGVVRCFAVPRRRPRRATRARAPRRTTAFRPRQPPPRSARLRAAACRSGLRTGPRPGSASPDARARGRGVPAHAGAGRTPGANAAGSSTRTGDTTWVRHRDALAAVAAAGAIVLALAVAFVTGGPGPTSGAESRDAARAHGRARSRSGRKSPVWDRTWGERDAPPLADIRRLVVELAGAPPRVGELARGLNYGTQRSAPRA